MGFTVFYLDFTGFGWVLLVFLEFYWVLLGYTCLLSILFENIIQLSTIANLDFVLMGF